jgi:2-keto-4-pentenoate hydratase
MRVDMPADTTDLVSVAVHRLAQARADRTAIPALTDDLDGLDLAAAYRVQAAQRDACDPLVGWKLGVTSRAKQAQVGVHEPIRGFLSAGHLLELGTPLPTAELIQPRVEPEIAFVMARDLSGANVTAAQVLAATSGVAPAVEVLDSRFRDYQFTMPDVVADNASAARFVIGAPVPVAGIDLRLVGVVLEHRGEVVATASGAAVLGHPAAAVGWLVRSLAAEGRGLREGDVVLSGGLTAAVAVREGDAVVVTIDRLGTVELACR